MICGSSRNKGSKHQYSRSNATHSHNHKNRHNGSKNGASRRIPNYSLNNINIEGTESSLSNLEEDINPQEHHRKPFTFAHDDKPSNGFNLNYHGHIDNHASPRQITLKSSNPYELIIDQKKLHKRVKTVYYPYLSWHWFDNRFEPVIDVQRRKHDPGPVILRLDGKTYPKCIPCSRENMERELFDEETILNLVKWGLRHFICYCAEHNHDCTYIKKAKQYKKKLQQSITQSKSLLKEKIKLQQQNDLLYHQLSNTSKQLISISQSQKSQKSHHSQSQSLTQINSPCSTNKHDIDIKAMKQDLKIYKESSRHWKKECSKEKKNLANTSRDFQELLKKSNTAQMEFDEIIKQQKQQIDELQAKHEAIQNQVKQLKETSVEYKQETESTKTELQNTQKQLNLQMNEMKEEYEQQIQSEKLINEKLQNEMLLLKKEKIEQDEQNKAAFTSAMQHNLAKIKELERERNDRNEEIVSLKKQIKNMQNEREKDIETLRNRFNEMNDLNRDLNEELGRFAKENNTISEELQRLETDNFELQKQLTAKTESKPPLIMDDDMDDMEDLDEKMNKLHRTWNLYDWYNKEETLQVIDDILSGDAEDDAIQHFFNSLREEHGYIHEAIINNEWNIWKFVQECKQIDHYVDALKKLLDEHPRVYAAIRAEDILEDLHADEYKNEVGEDEDEDEDDDDGDERMMFIDVSVDDEEDSYDDCVYDFQCHPEFAIGFVCDEIGKLKIYQTRKNESHLIKYAEMRQQESDHTAYCCAISPLGEYVGFGGGHQQDTKGIIVCYQIKSKHYIELKFVIEEDDEDQVALGAIHSIEFDENGQCLLAGNNAGDIFVFDVQHATCIQKIGYQQTKTKNTINDLCFYSNHIFILTDDLCFAYFYNCEAAQEETKPIDANSLKIIARNKKENESNPFKYIGVAQYNSSQLGEEGLIVYIASHLLQCYILNTNDHSLAKTFILQQNESNQTQITSLHIDHRNEYVLVSTDQNIKSYKIGSNPNEAEAKTIERSGISKCAVSHKYQKYVAICYEKPCCVELKRFIKK